MLLLSAFKGEDVPQLLGSFCPESTPRWAELGSNFKVACGQQAAALHSTHLLDFSFFFFQRRKEREEKQKEGSRVVWGELCGTCGCNRFKNRGGRSGLREAAARMEGQGRAGCSFPAAYSGADTLVTKECMFSFIWKPSIKCQQLALEN